ncbi:hypothetical protein JCM33374_g5676 [Metschnikowia sp. JCM 33374]|nr:hypothetical protein JCM33374_g5676 [Metschnikowia sp. JCM 33374]
MIQKLQEGISAISDAAGMDNASFKVLLCTLLSFPFSWVFKRLPDQRYTLKNVYVIEVSTFYIFGILDLGSSLYTLLFSSLGCYFITRYLRTNSMPWVNFLFLMSHLAYSHFSAQFFKEYDSTVIDITGAQMVMVMKLSAFGWNVYDGKQKVAPSEYTQSRAIRKHPDILPYLGYVFFYPSLLTGPAFDYIDYDKFIHGSLFDDVPDQKRPGKRKRRIPKSGRQALSKTLQGFFWAGLYLQAPKWVTLDYVFSDDFISKHGFIYRIFYLWVLGISHRLKYYTIWQIAEGACILCGIGYNGYDEKTKTFRWNRVQNIDPWRFETGQNVHTCLEMWNMNTNKWLKHYVYTRIAKPGKKPGFKSTLFTFATSAFWHGTRPGYYMTFVLGAFVQTVGKIYRRNFRPLFLEADGKTPKPSKKVYDLVCFVVTQLTFGFICQPFVILDFRRSLYCWATVYFYVPIGIVLTLFAFKGPYKNKIEALCRANMPQAPTVAAKPSLNRQESQRVAQAVEKALSERDDCVALGVPPIDVLEGSTKEELEEEMKEISDAWQSFRGRRGSFSNDMDGLKDAYNNFANEINEILQTKKEEIQKKNP